MQLSSEYISGFVIVFAGLILTLSSCDEILIGNLEEGDPVQVKVEVYNSTAAATPAGSGFMSSRSATDPIIDELRIYPGKASVGNADFQMFSFILNDSLLNLYENGESRYLAEKVIPAGVYEDVYLLLGDSTQVISGNTTNSVSSMRTIELTGIYNNEEFLIRSDVPIQINLKIDPSLQVKKNTDSLSILTLYFDSSKWFTGANQTAFLDPTDGLNSDEIINNIIASAGLKKSNTKHDPKVDNRGDDDRPSLSIGESVALESDETIGFMVKLSEPAEEEVQVDFATSDMSAKAGEDYVEASGTLTFSPGDTEQILEVEVLDDLEIEQEEKFSVRLLNPVNASIENNSKIAKGMIVDDDGEETSEITICHYPPGDPENPQTITISESAWPAHQEHGDSIGACPDAES